MPSISTKQSLDTLVSKMKENLIDIIWAPIKRSPNRSSWVDIYSGGEIPQFAFWPGFPDNNSNAVLMFR